MFVNYDMYEASFDFFSARFQNLNFKLYSKDYPYYTGNCKSYLLSK